jgi:UDP-glucose 4-epimerase
MANGEGGAFNLANAQGYSVKQVIATAEQVCGRAIHADAAPRRMGDPPILIGDADRARRLLGWKPARSELSQQIGDAWNWLQSAG